MKVSLFEISYKKKLTFSLYSIFVYVPVYYIIHFYLSLMFKHCQRVSFNVAHISVLIIDLIHIISLIINYLLFHFLFMWISLSGQWGYSGVSKSGWDPTASSALPSWGPPAGFPVLFGDGFTAPGSAWAPSLVPEGQSKCFAAEVITYVMYCQVTDKSYLPVTLQTSKSLKNIMKRKIKMLKLYSTSMPSKM